LGGFSSSLMRHASDGWRTARQLTNQPLRRAIPEALSEVWSIVLRLANSRNLENDRSPQLEAIHEACREIREGGGVSSFTWHKISQGRVSNSSYADAMSASKERRVEVFESAVNALTHEAPDELSASFLVGYLASLVSGGSLEHSHLVFPLRDRLPTAMLWYGICSGLQPNNRVLTDYSYLGLRLVRAMNRREILPSPPACDIALNELEVLFRGDPRGRGFRQANTSFLRIEVAPTVTTVVKWPLRPNDGGQLGLFEGEDRPRVSEYERLRELVAALRGSLSLAESMLAGQTMPPSQQRGKRQR
jgi:hypothetical protein